ncbi:MAG: hypothetical protein MJ252_30365 [archaeon]|nr:hypothetical protein [archaeon]
MNEYKGIYYGNNKEQKFYEAGAHFKYSDLYNVLLYLSQEEESKELSYSQERNISAEKVS